MWVLWLGKKNKYTHPENTPCFLIIFVFVFVFVNYGLSYCLTQRCCSCPTHSHTTMAAFASHTPSLPPTFLTAINATHFSPPSHERANVTVKNVQVE